VRRARAARRLPEPVDPADLADLPVELEAPAFDPELVAALEGALDGVPPASQLVLRMHYLDGLTHVEVAEALDLSVGTVKSRLGYGLAWLRKTVPRAG
jgi:RNA polymerase sigma factor (sigma-70 family)